METGYRLQRYGNLLKGQLTSWLTKQEFRTEVEIPRTVFGGIGLRISQVATADIVPRCPFVTNRPETLVAVIVVLAHFDKIHVWDVFGKMSSWTNRLPNTTNGTSRKRGHSGSKPKVPSDLFQSPSPQGHASSILDRDQVVISRTGTVRRLGRVGGGFRFATRVRALGALSDDQLGIRREDSANHAQKRNRVPPS